MAILHTKQTRTRFCTQNGCTKLYLKLTKRLFAITALTHTNEHVFEVRVKVTVIFCKKQVLSRFGRLKWIILNLYNNYHEHLKYFFNAIS